MRFLVLFTMMIGLALAAGGVRAEDATRFSSVIDDLPLMSAIHEVGEGVDFSTPDGRIAEVNAEGKVAQADVLAFYDDTLPQLGWTRKGPGVYVREDETLSVTFERSGAVLHVRFQLAPTDK